jgi:F420H(2)-dependent quinone reductase
VKIAKWIGISFFAYAGLVIAFESMIGYFQPANETTLVITTTDESGASSDRVVARLESDSRLYVAANHWPRAWYTRAGERPGVTVTIDGKTSAYQAVRVTGEESDRVNREHSLPLVFRFLTGFPPRNFLRLDPR